jgi:hypothetical protein
MEKRKSLKERIEAVGKPQTVKLSNGMWVDTDKGREFKTFEELENTEKGGDDSAL